MNLNTNILGPTMKLSRKFYKTKKEANEGEDGEDVVGWGRHPVCRPAVTDARVLPLAVGREFEDAVAFFSL